MVHMTPLQVRPMSDEEFARFREATIRDYAAEKVAAREWPAETAVDRASTELAELLPDGAGTPGALLLSGFSDQTHVGFILISPRAGGLPGAAWIYGIEIDEGQRGQGLGRALLEAGEQAAQLAGYRTIGLNVFGANAVARRLYESSGYEIDAMQMSKPLHDSAG
jgi:ribosomal protein S18 acetylase RimI-like enzyme